MGRKKVVKKPSKDRYLEYQAKGYDSPIEYKFDDYAKKAGLKLQKGVKIPIDQGGYAVRHYKPDFYIETSCGKRYIIELDGRRYHSYMKDRENDYIRERYLTRNGYIVIRFTGSEINKRPQKCVHELKEMIGHIMSKTV